MRPTWIRLIPDGERRSRKLNGCNLEVINNMEDLIYGGNMQQQVGSSETLYLQPPSVQVPLCFQSCDAMTRVHSSGQDLSPKMNEKQLKNKTIIYSFY
jgi:hypothetical protein